MIAATHFIEVFKTNGKTIQGPISEIKNMERNLKHTAAAPSLKTIAVWKISFKQGYVPQNN